MHLVATSLLFYFCITFFCSIEVRACLNLVPMNLEKAKNKRTHMINNPYIEYESD